MSIDIGKLSPDSTYTPGYKVVGAMDKNGKNVQGIITKNNVEVGKYVDKEWVWIPNLNEASHPYYPHDHYVSYPYLNDPTKPFSRDPYGHYEQRIKDEGFTIRGQKFSDSGYKLVDGVIVNPKEVELYEEISDAYSKKVIRVAIDRDNNGAVSEKDTQIAIKLNEKSWKPEDTEKAGKTKMFIGGILLAGGMVLAGPVVVGIGAAIGGMVFHSGVKDYENKFDQIGASTANITFEQ